jgi:excisionase family DNA binding protein
MESFTTAPVPLTAANEPMVADVLTRLDRIEALVAKFVSEMPRRRRGEDSRLLTMSQAARRLGVSRTRTLPLLIQDRRIRTVTVAGQTRIPASEVERIEAEGTAHISTKKRRQRSASEAPLVTDMVTEAARIKVV